MSSLKVNNLQVGQDATSTNNFTLYQPSTPNGNVRLGVGNIGAVTDVLTITSSGKLGIGTTDPDSGVTVVGSSVRTYNSSKTRWTEIGADGNIEIVRAEGNPYIDFKSAAGEDADCRIQQDSNGLKFITGGNGATADRFVITSDGNIGIGTTTPTASSNFELYKTGDAFITVHNPSNSRGGIGGLTSQRLALLTTAPEDDLCFGYVNNTTLSSANFVQRMILDNGNGNLTINAGNLVIGSSGKGVDFSVYANAAGMTSELLNDYEEGTWTPTINGWTGTYTRQMGVYTKIGKVVYVMGEVILNSGTGNHTQGFPGPANLPFVLENNGSSYYGAWTGVGTGISPGASWIGSGPLDRGGDNAFFPNVYGVNQGTGNLSSAQLGTAGGYRFFAVYRVS